MQNAVERGAGFVPHWQRWQRLGRYSSGSFDSQFRNASNQMPCNYGTKSRIANLQALVIMTAHPSLCTIQTLPTHSPVLFQRFHLTSKGTWKTHLATYTSDSCEDEATEKVSPTERNLIEDPNSRVRIYPPSPLSERRRSSFCHRTDPTYPTQ